MSEKVIFLDIDGPMISSLMILVNRMASFQREFPSTAIAAMNEVCERTGAKIVLNTTHNRPIRGVMNIDDALVNQGLDAEHLHSSDRHTKYPEIQRDIAVNEWLHRHPEVTAWVAFDDARFTDKENLIWIDPDTGITVPHLNAAIDQLGGKQILILM